jgi:hypothetical protein
MIEIIAEILGLIGAAIIILMYFMLERGTIQSKDLSYPSYNLVGAILILFSLHFNWNLASIVIECFWIAISIYGVVRCIRRKKIIS